MISFLPLGGADEIGASCFYLNVDGTGILLDCGIHPRKKGNDSLPKFELINDLPLDFALISHAHQDHIGSLPFLVQQFPHVIIYSTPQTKEIAEITLHNAANILEYDPEKQSEYKIYSHEEIDLLVSSMRTIEYNKIIELVGIRHNSREPVKLTFFDAGHILGSAGILIEYNEQKIFYTGDINIGRQSIMIEADLTAVKNIDTLILESTYGATESEKITSWQSEAKRLVKRVNQVLHNGGSVLIPVFALGKTQEILSTIFTLMQLGLLTESNIYTAGIGKDISRIYDNNRYLVRRDKIDLQFKEIIQNNIYDIEDLNYFKKNPGIVLASSGMMLQGTTSYKLLNYWLRQESFGVFGVGYMDPDTPGYRVINSVKGESIQLSEFGEHIKVNCEVERFYFPSHSKREELLEIVKRVNPFNVILIHGEQNAKDWLGYNILNKFKHIRLHSAEIRKQINITKTP
jgi:cleavage and polyadenylation specificity factor subunit 3